MTIITEKVQQSYEARPGRVATRTFWVAYPEHVVSYGLMGDRVARAWGRGKTRRDALQIATDKTRGQSPRAIVETP